MPEISGWEYLDLLLEHNLSMPVIIVSSSIDPKDKERAESHPLVEAFIDNPLSKRHLYLIKRYVPIVE